MCLLCLMGSVVAAQPAPALGHSLRARNVVLPESASASLPEVRIAPGVLTVLEFDAPLAPDSVALEGRAERFARVEVTSHLVALRPSVALAEGERLLLSVRFTDGQVPAHATLALVPASSEVDGQVQVVRRPRSPQFLETELEAVRARCESGCFVKLVLAGMMKEGIRRLPLVHHNEEGSPFGISQAVLHRAQTHAVVSVQLLLQEEQSPWMPGEAWLLDKAGHVVRKLPIVTPGTALMPGEQRPVAVELEWPSHEPGHSWDLELRERDGVRHVRLSGLRR